MTTNSKSSLPVTPDGSTVGGRNLQRPQRVVLNVQGRKFQTTSQTLRRIPDSFFDSLLSGRFGDGEIDENGITEFFIDRDPTHFQSILNFLVAGMAYGLPPDTAGKEQLAIEADYYGIDALVTAVRRPSLDITEFLPEEICDIWKEEREMRQEFCDVSRSINNGIPYASNPYKRLVRLFGQTEDVDDLTSIHGGPTIPCPLLLNKSKRALLDKSSIVMDLRKDIENQQEIVPVTVSSLDEFVTNFNRQFPNILHRLRDLLRTENVIVAGGSVLRALSSGETTRTNDFWDCQTMDKCNKSDIDLFLYGVNREDANRIVRRIFFTLAADQEKWAIIRSR
jgi:hypothetical protein